MTTIGCQKASYWSSKRFAILPKRILQGKARFHRLANSLPKNTLQLNRAIKYIPYVLSRAAGAPRGSSLKGGAGREDRANNTSAASSHKARAVGHDTHTGMMILALATRHRVERPATRMGGGTLNPMERPCPSPFEMPLIYDCELENPHRSTVRILSCRRRHRFCKGSTKMSPSLP